MHAKIEGYAILFNRPRYTLDFRKISHIHYIAFVLHRNQIRRTMSLDTDVIDGLTRHLSTAACISDSAPCMLEKVIESVEKHASTDIILLRKKEVLQWLFGDTSFLTCQDQLDDARSKKAACDIQKFTRMLGGSE